MCPLHLEEFAATTVDLLGETHPFRARWNPIQPRLGGQRRFNTANAIRFAERSYDVMSLNRSVLLESP